MKTIRNPEDMKTIRNPEEIKRIKQSEDYKNRKSVHSHGAIYELAEVMELNDDWLNRVWPIHDHKLLIQDRRKFFQWDLENRIIALKENTGRDADQEFREQMYKYFLINEINSFIPDQLKEEIKPEYVREIELYEGYCKKELAKSEGHQPKEENITLDQFCKTPELYKKAMQILVDAEVISPDTYYWIDPSGGKKKYWVSIIKTIHKSGYLLREPSVKEYCEIAKNTFHLPISESMFYKSLKDPLPLKFNIETV